MSDMIVVKIEDMQLVGMNGEILCDCGRSLPVAYWPPEKVYGMFTHDSPVELCHNQDQMDEYKERGLWTDFPQPIQAFVDATAVYLSEALLATLDADISYFSKFGNLLWQTVESDGKKVWVTYITWELSQEILDDIAKKVTDKTKKALDDYCAGCRDISMETIDLLTHQGSQSATSEALTRQAYINYGRRLLLEGNLSGIHNIHRFFVKIEFPKWSFRQFRRECEGLNKLKTR